MYVAVFATDKPGTADARREHFNAFVEYLREHPNHPDVAVHHGGPTLSEDASTMIGTLLVLEAPSLDAVRAFVADSPLGRAGVYGDVQVRPWEWRTGKPE
ncbi:MAG: YciI family protein [Gammaproteobacteria bacterium]|nr:YciI family protein [Gammaproteobacteria bacterium]